MATLTIRDLLEAGIHFGHQTRRWNPKMKPFIFGQRNGIYIIDLQKTIRQLKKAYVCVRDTVARGGTVLFVGTKKQAQEAVVREAQRCGMYYVDSRWLGGTLTNWQTIRQSIRTLVRLEDMDESGKLEEMFKKKEAIRMRKRAAKLETSLGGIKAMPGLPDVLFVIDAKKEAIAIREAARMGIPCIAIVDTNSDPELVPIPIPGNDDAIRAISLYCSIMADAVLDGRMHGEKAAADEGGKEAQFTAAAAAPQEDSVEPAAVPESVAPDTADETDRAEQE